MRAAAAISVLAGALGCGGAGESFVTPPAVAPGPPAREEARAPVVKGEAPAHVIPGPFRFDPALALPRPVARTNIAGGLAVLDVDGDGDLDVLTLLDDAPPVLLLNRGGLRFEEQADRAGIPASRAYASALGDCDGDGALDLALAAADGLHLLRHAGPSFEEVAGALPSRDEHEGSLLFLDADGDTDLDLYVTCYFHAGPCADRLLVNDGACRFRDETEARGPLGTGAGHAVAALDLDSDGDPDIAVANDRGYELVPDELLENDGTGHFREVGAARGLGQAAYSMSVLVADVDGDGELDVAKGNICRSPVLLGHGGTFADAGRTMGLPDGWVLAPGEGPLDLPALGVDEALDRFIATYAQAPPDPQARCLTTWSVEAPDLDADGRRELVLLDAAVGNGFEARVQPDRLHWRAPGRDDFTEVSASAGLDDAGQGRTAVFADLDGDGDLDAVFGNGSLDPAAGGPGHVYRHVRPGAGNAIFVDLRGPGANTSGVGATVEVVAGGRRQVAYRSLGTSFLASSAAPLHFGLGPATEADVTVRWPWGAGVQTAHARAGERLVVKYGQ